MSYYREQLENWLSKIDVKAGRVLDVGGAAKPVVNRVKSWEAGEYKILDALAEKAEAKPDYISDINRPFGNNVPAQKISCDPFDVIFCLEVFEYVWNPADALSNLMFMLKKGGLLYISFPFVYPIHNPKEHDCLRYTEFGIRKLMEYAGFEILEIEKRVLRQPAKLAEAYAADGMHGRYDLGVTGYLVKAQKR